MSEQNESAYFAKLRSMNDDELREELGEAGSLKWRNSWVKSSTEAFALVELLVRTHSAIMAFMDPDGNPPENTGEFREIKSLGEEIAAYLGIAPYVVTPRNATETQPYLDRSPFSGIEVTRGNDYSDACQPREMRSTLEIGEGKLAFAAA